MRDEKRDAALDINNRACTTFSPALSIWHNFCQILKIGHNFDAFGKKFCGLFCQNIFGIIWHILNKSGKIQRNRCLRQAIFSFADSW